MSLFSEAIDFAHQAFEDVMGESVTYKLKQDDIVIPDAVAETSSSAETIVSGEVRSATRQQAWLIRPERIVKDGTQFEPRRGHRILRSNGDLYEVQNPTGGVVWEWSDQHQTRMRIMTVEIKAS